MKKRTRGRELALQFLYQVDLLGSEALPEAGTFFKTEEPEGSEFESGLGGYSVLGAGEEEAATP